MASSRPARTVIPSSKLGPDNAGDMELTSHQKAIATQAAKSRQPSTPHELVTSASPLVSSQLEVATHSDGSPTPVPKPRKRTALVLSDDEDLSDTQAASDNDSPKPVAARKRKKKRKANPSQSKYSHGWTLLSY